MALRSLAAAKLFGFHRICSSFRRSHAPDQSRLAHALLPSTHVSKCIQNVSNINNNILKYRFQCCLRINRLSVISQYWFFLCHVLGTHEHPSLFINWYYFTLDNYWKKIILTTDNYCYWLKTFYYIFLSYNYYFQISIRCIKVIFYFYRYDA